MNFHQIWRVWLKKWACHANFEFLDIFGGKSKSEARSLQILYQVGFYLGVSFWREIQICAT